MGLRCLLGHDFGPSGVVREHEEDGSEMVVTERELRRCRRCGEEQVLSESTEVRAIRPEEDVRPERRDADAVAPASSTQGADVGDDASPLGGGSDAESSASPPVGDDQPAESTPDTAALRNAAESVTDPGDAGPASASETAPELDPSGTTDEDTADEPESNTSLIERAEAGFDEPADPEEEDAVILDTEDDEPERERGAWPDSGDVESRSGASAPDDSPVDSRAADLQSDADESLPENGDAVADDGADEPQSLAERAAEEDAELMGSASEPDTDDPETQQTQQPDTASTEDAWPAHDGEDEGFSAGAATAGGPGMAYGNELTPGSDSGSGSGSTNSRRQNEQSSDDYETSYLENTVEQRDGDGTIVSAGSSERAEPSPGAETEYYCPNCGHTRPLDSSLRTGDICPECQQGYIAERER